MQNKCLAIRADATQIVGIGHVMRCLVLAEAWKRKAGSVYLIGNVDDDGIKQRVTDGGIDLLPIDTPDGQYKDLEQTLGYLNDLRKTCSTDGTLWVVLDGYGFDSEYQKELKNNGFSILVMDDIIHLPQYHADIILNQNMIPNNVDYAADTNTVILAGPKYRLIRNEFFENDRRKRNTPKKAKKLLLTFGGADTKNVTACAIRLLNEIEDPELHVRIVVGPTNAKHGCLADELKHAPYKYELLQTIDRFPSLISWADIGIAAGGGTCFEMMLSGLPAILIPVNDNQVENVCTLCDMGAALSPGRIEDLDAAHFRTLLKELIADPMKREQMSRQGASLIDRYSTDRIFSVMDAVSRRPIPEKFVLRNATRDDAKQLFRLANNPTVRRNSFSPAQISFEDHLQWLDRKLLSPHKTAIYVYDYEGLIIAQARYDKRDSRTAEIDFSVHPAFRTFGIGTSILSQTYRAVARHFKTPRIIGEVFESNTPSKNCFRKTGFKEIGKKIVKGSSCFVYEWDSANGFA